MLLKTMILVVLVVLIAFYADTPGQYLLALFLLGIGWNFLYIGGSSLIVSLTFPEEQGKVQGIADFVIFGTVAISSLSAGLMHYLIGWDKMVLWSLPILFIIFIANLIRLK